MPQTVSVHGPALRPCAAPQSAIVLRYLACPRSDAVPRGTAVPLHSSATPWRSPAVHPCTGVHRLPQLRDPLCALALLLAPRATGSALEYWPPFPTAAQFSARRWTTRAAAKHPEAAHPPHYAPSNRPPRSATPSSCSVPRLRPPRQPTLPLGTLRLDAVPYIAPMQHHVAQSHGVPRNSPTNSPCTAQHWTPAQPRTAALQNPPYTVPRRAPGRPLPAPLRVPALCPGAAPRGALAEPQGTPLRCVSPCAVPARLRSCRAVTACGLLSAAPGPTPRPQPPRPSVPTHHQPRRMACTGLKGSPQRPSAPALARLSVVWPDCPVRPACQTAPWTSTVKSGWHDHTHPPTHTQPHIVRPPGPT